jgi:hypothetical protein
MLFGGNSSRADSAFLSPENIPDSLLFESIYSDSDLIVYNAMMESMGAVYHSVCARDQRIIMEGLGDMAKTAWDFFVNLLKKFANFIKNAFNYLASYILDFDKFIEKYKDNIGKFKPFEVQGFTYTIDTKEVDNCGIEQVINGYNNMVHKIKDMEIEKIHKLISDEISKNTIDTLRGKIAGVGHPVKAANFDKELFKQYRDGKDAKHTIKVDSSAATGFIQEYKHLKDVKKELQNDARNVEALFNDLIDFFKSMPQTEYADSSDKRINKYRLSGDRKAGTATSSADGNESYSDDLFRKNMAWYNFCFKMSKDISYMYSKAFTTKLAAVKEALSFDRGVLRSALSPFADKEAVKDSATEYTLDAIGSENEQNTLEYFHDFTHYIDEIDVLGEAYLKGMVMLEDVEVNGTDKDGVLESILKFIRNIIAKFVDTAKNLFKNNTEWFQQNARKFDNIDDNVYAKLKISIIPYEKIGAYKILDPSIRSTDSRLGTDNLKDNTSIAKAMYGSILSKSVSGDVSEAAKIHYRGGSNNLQEYTGSNVKSMVMDMIKYCNNYVEVANGIKNEVDGIAKEVEDAQAELEKTVNNESFSIAEGQLLENTIFGLMPWVDKDGNVQYITEAGENGDEKQSTPPTGNGSVVSADSPSGAEGDHEQTQEEKEAAQKAKDAKVGNKNSIKIYYQIKLKVATAMMTIAEERYNAYLRTLRQILVAAGVNKDKKTEEKK